LDLDPIVPRDAEQPAHPLDHDRARLVDRRPDQRDALAAGHRQLVDPLRPGARLAEAAPGHHQPHPPALGRRRQLPPMGPKLEIGVEPQQVGRRQLGDQRLLLLDRQRQE